MVTPAAKRELLRVSERRACAVLGIDRTSVRYRSGRPGDAGIRRRLRELAAVRRRFGYRRLHILMRREGFIMNHKKLRRPYREERLQVRRRFGRKRALGTRAPMTIPQSPNQRRSLDFLSDAFADGRPFRILAVVDDFTRECRRHIAGRSAGCPRTRCCHRPSRAAGDVCFRQQQRADRYSYPALDPGDADRVALHRENRNRMPS